MEEVLLHSEKIERPLKKSNSARIEKDKSSDDIKFKTVVRGGSFSIGVGGTGSAALLAKPLDRKSGIEADNDDASIQWAMLPARMREEANASAPNNYGSDDEDECATLLTEMNLDADQSILDGLGSATTDAEGITEKDLVSPRYVPVATAELTKNPSKAAVAKPLK